MCEALVNRDKILIFQFLSHFITSLAICPLARPCGKCSAGKQYFMQPGLACSSQNCSPASRLYYAYPKTAPVTQATWLVQFTWQRHILLLYWYYAQTTVKKHSCVFQGKSSLWTGLTIVARSFPQIKGQKTKRQEFEGSNAIRSC